MIIAIIVVAALRGRPLHRSTGRAPSHLRRVLAPGEGRLGLAGLTAEVTVARDRWGMPHVNAISMEDAAFAVGVVHAQDRLWQMEVTRRVATGRISELIGIRRA